MKLNVAAFTAIRERSGITINGLARLAEVSQPNLIHVLAGRRNASDETILRLARALKVPVMAIILDHPDQPPPE